MARNMNAIVARGIWPAVLLMALASEAVAGGGPVAELYVAPCGDDTWSGIAPSCTPGDGPKRTIQAAIDAAVNGDRISVAPGTYFEAIDFLGKDIEVVSAAGAAVTFIDGSAQTASVVTFANMEPVTARLDGFTIQNGVGTDVQIMPGPPPVFQRFGGGVLCDEANPTIAGCVFQFNMVPTATGGAIANRVASPTIIDCTFANNLADDGGAIANCSSSSPTIRSCAFIGNSANSGGAIANSGGSSPHVSNSVFDDNEATVSGGALHNSLASSPVLVNCTVSGNAALAGFGGGLYNSSASPSITNCIVWDNTDPGGSDTSAQIHVDSGVPAVEYSCVQGGWTGAGGQNTASNPLFNDAGTGDYTLGDFSPAIDAGDNTALPVEVTADLNGAARFGDDLGVTDLGQGVSPIVDMGAFERQSNSESTFVRVPLDFPSIQEGINAAAASGAVIEVTPGTYVERIDLLGKAIVIRPTPGPGAVVLDGGGTGNVVTIDSGEGNATRLEDLTIRGGMAPGGSGIFIDNGSSPIVHRCTITDNNAGFGGGVHVAGQSHPIVLDCTITNNSAGLGGGVYAAEQSQVAISECDFSGNTASIGGGVYALQGSVNSIADCSFISNSAIGSGFGGAIYTNGSSPAVTECSFAANNGINGGAVLIANSSNPSVFNCSFVGNIAVNNGGAIAVDTCSSPSIANCAFSGNQGRFGGAVHTGNSCFPVPASITLGNSTFANNTAEIDGGAVYVTGIGISVANSVLWQNAPNQIFQLFPTGANVVFSDVEGGWVGLGNLNLPPLFVNPAGADGMIGTLDDDVSVSGGSATIDAASNTFIVPGSTFADLAGNGRIVNGTVDMGAYEFQGVSGGCPADFNENGVVDFADILILLGTWGPCATCPQDLDEDGAVGFSDLLVLLGAWGACP